MRLEQLLHGQDFGTKELDNILQRALNDEPQTDPITQIIVNAWANNGGGEGEFDKDHAYQDIAYAKHQLDIALRKLNN